MKTGGRQALYVIGLALTLSVLMPARTMAQSLDLPAPSSQTQPPLHYRAAPTPMPQLPPSNDVETIPSIPQSIAPAPQPTQEAAPILPPAPQPAPPPPLARPPGFQHQPILPAIFRGCWQGKVNFLDSHERVPGSPPASWTPKTYRLCYERVGDGPFELTFTDAGVVYDRRISHPRGRMQLLSTDGRRFASMRAFLHFDEYFGRSSFPVDEVTNLQCEIRPDGMYVAGAVSGTNDGSPWFRARWHTVLTHVAQASARRVPE